MHNGGFRRHIYNTVARRQILLYCISTSLYVYFSCRLHLVLCLRKKSVK
jgi:hypothetical protein